MTEKYQENLIEKLITDADLKDKLPIELKIILIPLNL